jgi:hypothetical protein
MDICGEILLRQRIQPLRLQIRTLCLVECRVMARRPNGNCSHQFPPDCRVESRPCALRRPARISWKTATVILCCGTRECGNTCCQHGCGDEIELHSGTSVKEGMTRRPQYRNIPCASLLIYTDPREDYFGGKNDAGLQQPSSRCKMLDAALNACCGWTPMEKGPLLGLHGPEACDGRRRTMVCAHSFGPPTQRNSTVVVATSYCHVVGDNHKGSL